MSTDHLKNAVKLLEKWAYNKLWKSLTLMEKMFSSGEQARIAIENNFDDFDMNTEERVGEFLANEVPVYENMVKELEKRNEKDL